MNLDKAVAKKEINALIDKFPEYSICESLYSWLRPMGEEKRTAKLSDILKIKDTDIQNRINKAKKIENGN